MCPCLCVCVCVTIFSMEARPSGSPQRDFSIQLETDEEWEALILDPNQHVVLRTVGVFIWA